jgi:ribosomal protein S18 acetylase RimI-like enzyme
MTNKVNLRICNPGDENTLSLLGQSTFLESFAGLLDGNDILGHCASQHSSIVYRGWLEHANTKTWVAEIEPGNAPVGYLVLVPPILPIADSQVDDIEIKRLYLLHPFRGIGIGKRLMAEALIDARNRNCRRVLLEVYAGNTGAIAFYQKLGFVNVGQRSFKVINNYYEHITMALTL